MIPKAADLEGRTLRIAEEFKDRNPRRPYTHGWLAFEVLRRAPGGKLSFNSYAHRLFEPDAEIRNLAKSIPGEPDAYQHFKHIRCDISRGVVLVEPPLGPDWYKVRRCSNGNNPFKPV